MSEYEWDDLPAGLRRYIATAMWISCVIGLTIGYAIGALIVWWFA